uniref:Uncharacterized protein n=1 Tax=Anguilla anguilla TaxID=7936 RepID=A0A0E9U4D6_ANGAN
MIPTVPKAQFSKQMEKFYRSKSFDYATCCLPTKSPVGTLNLTHLLSLTQ